MTTRILKIDATNINEILNYRFDGGYDGGSYTAIIDCVSHNVDIGDYVIVSLGYENGSYDVAFTGYVKQIERKIPDDTYTIYLYDVLIRAVDYFIASSNPDNAYKIKNISAEDLVGDILNMAGITNYGHGTTNFTFGVHGEGEANLTGAYDFIHGVADLLAWHIYADKSGKVWFVDRKPYIMDGDIEKFTITDILRIGGYSRSDRDLRNRVVVYGKGVYAEAHASSSYLPPGFYKSVVLSSPFIDDQTFAQRACDYNLEKLNRLTEELSIAIEGIPGLFPLDVVKIDNPDYPFINGKWLVYQLSTSFGKNGFIQELVLRK